MNRMTLGLLLVGALVLAGRVDAQEGAAKKAPPADAKKAPPAEAKKDTPADAKKTPPADAKKAPAAEPAAEAEGGHEACGCADKLALFTMMRDMHQASIDAVKKDTVAKALKGKAKAAYTKKTNEGLKFHKAMVKALTDHIKVMEKNHKAKGPCLKELMADAPDEVKQTLAARRAAHAQSMKAVAAKMAELAAAMEQPAQ